MGRDLFRRLGGSWLGRGDIEAEFEDEFEHHRALREAELIEAGLTPAAARDETVRTFGNVQGTRAAYLARRARALRRARVRSWFGGLHLDLRAAVRSFRRRPTYSLTAVLVLALGIAAPTTVFSLVRAIFFDRPAHVVEPHRLIRVFRSWAPGEGGGMLQHADYVYYRDNATALSGLAAYGDAQVASYRLGVDAPGQLTLSPVSSNYFDVLGVPPLLGRMFRAEENSAPGVAPVVLLSHGFWASALGADETVVGRVLQVNGVGMTIVGVTPAGFRGISPVDTAPDAWMPIAMQAAVTGIDPVNTGWWERHPNYISRWLDLIGRVADGYSIEAATANLESLASALDYPDQDPDEGVLVTPSFLYRPSQQASLSTLFRVLAGVVAILLLVVVANATVLLLSGVTARWSEMGVRSAIGAGRARVVRQLLVECGLLGGIGGLLGIVAAYLFSDAAGSLLPLPFDTSFTPDAGVLAGAVALTMGVSLVVALLPGLYAAGAEVTGLLRSRGLGGGGRSRMVLVVTQVALSLILSSGAFLFARSYWRANTEQLGFDRDAGIIVRVDLRGLGYTSERGLQFIAAGVEALREIPGVTGVATTRGVPFGGQWSTTMYASDAGAGGSEEDQIPVGLNAVSVDYFDVLGVDIVMGRAFDARDDGAGARVVIVNETLARFMWGDDNPIGRTLGRGDSARNVVGVARDGVYYELGEPQWAHAFYPVRQVYQSTVSFVVRSGRGAAPSLQAVQETLLGIEPQLAFRTSTSMDAIVEAETARYEVSALLVGLSGLLALLLTATALYGVIAFGVARGRRDIGVRMALGAGATRVARAVLTGSVKLVLVGSALGLLGSLALRRYTAALLYRVEPSDPAPLLLAGLALVLVTLLAAWVPTQRAVRVDPMDALRGQ